MKVLSVLTTCFISINVFCQGPIITPLQNNHALNRQNTNSKRQLTDTIKLPFIDDFTSTELVPNQLYWNDNQVYVNSHFAISPPSYGVATFDNLNAKGKPYQTLSGLTTNHCDSLTSNFINLFNYKTGLTWKNYLLSDSIYLSFFYQMQGKGDVLDNTDSLVLKFKQADGQWNTVWKTIGKNYKPFIQAMVPIKKSNYLFNNFQFRFINYGKTTGNMNQWHLDYIRLNSGRTYTDTAIREVAINAVPEGPLQWFETMPYDHFKVNPNFHTIPAHAYTIRNNNNVPVNVQFGCEVRNQYNQLVLNYPFNATNRNVKEFSDTSEAFLGLKLDTFSGKLPSLSLKYRILPLANDVTADDYNSISNNNDYTKHFKFQNYFAYDDGSAEGGYGLDYGSLPAGPGYAAIRFNLPKSDTLRGISVFFNRSVSEITGKNFYITIWKKLSEPPANTDDNDVIAKQIEVASAVYSDSINGFVNFVLDTAIALNAGNFYIGWQQNTNFILNVGYDNNYKYGHSGGKNPNLFYNLNGYWENVSSTITGAPMMRPLVGPPLPKQSTRLTNTTTTNTLSVYPNPIENSSILNINTRENIVSIEIYDVTGKLLLNQTGELLGSIDIAALSKGVYFIKCTSANNAILNSKFIKN